MSNRNEQIKNAYFAFDESYEELEVQPYNCCEDYFTHGALWADSNPSKELLLKVFDSFNKHGLLRDDLCFDQEHFIETVTIPEIQEGRV